MKYPQKFSMFLYFFFFSVFVSGGTPKMASPVGIWKTVNKRTGKTNVHIKIFIKNGELFGRIVYIRKKKDRNMRCTKCTGSRKNKPFMGMIILRNFKQDWFVWSGGYILHPYKGKEYRAKIWLETPDRLKVRGYWFIFHRTQYWYRVK